MSNDKQKFSASPAWTRQLASEHKNLLLLLLIILLIGIYLYLAHFFIYYRLERAHITVFNRQAIYTLGDNQTNSTSLVYAALGDSFTNGLGADQYEESYPYLLAEKLAQAKQTKITLSNFSYSGARTKQLITEQLNQAIATKPNIITLLIGTNDVHGGISQADFEKNYEYIVDRLTKETSAKIYLLGLPNVGTNGLLWPPYNYYFRQKTQAYNNIIQTLAQKYNLTYIDLETPTTLASKKNLGFYSKDSFHPSALGYELWTQIIYDNFDK